MTAGPLGRPQNLGGSQDLPRFCVQEKNFNPESVPSLGSPSPITRSPLVVCDREDEDALRFDTVDQAVRKPRDSGLPERGSRHRARPRVTPDKEDGSFDAL